MREAKIIFGFSPKTYEHRDKIVIDDMSIPLIEDSNKASSSKNNLFDSSDSETETNSSDFNSHNRPRKKKCKSSHFMNTSDLRPKPDLILEDSLKVIAEGVEVLELDPCSKCKEEFFLYELKKPFTILICGHIYHRSCLEDYVKDLPQCPECAMEIESIDYARYYGISGPSSQDRAQNTSDPMQISPQMTSSQNQNTVTPYTSLIFNPTLSYDPTTYPNYVDLTKNKEPRSKKRLRDESAKKEPPNLKKLIDELSTEDPNSAKNNISTESVTIPTTENDPDPVNFLNLYKELISAEDDNRKSNQEVIKRYYNFGLNLTKRLEYHKKSHKKQVAKILVNDEVRNQISNEKFTNFLMPLVKIKLYELGLLQR
ncbi:9297_t:CDS:2 [Dentiscutata erythropus]|uniref:9297_t:CDS:1 n=1 Tax=Dentiscutata erythropus TaxID=1348616 RepID=A0A9N9CYM0_9GLOM|nr:9297_t:CDS:2 [Dentiscutata erythropus]